MPALLSEPGKRAQGGSGPAGRWEREEALPGLPSLWVAPGPGHSSAGAGQTVGYLSGAKGLGVSWRFCVTWCPCQAGLVDTCCTCTRDSGH